MVGAAASVAAVAGLAWLISRDPDGAVGAGPAGTSGGPALTAIGCCDDQNTSIQLVRYRGGAGKMGVAEPVADPAAETSVAALSEALSTAPDRPGKLAAADALATIGSPEAVEQLLTRALEEPDLGLRREIAGALAALDDRTGLEALTSAVAATSDRALLDAVTETLSRMGDGETVEHLAELYRGEQQIRRQRNSVRRALAGMRNPEAARALASLATTAPEPGLVEAAARGLSKIGGATAAQGLADAIGQAGNDPQLHASLLGLVRRIDDPAGLKVLSNLELLNP